MDEKGLPHLDWRSRPFGIGPVQPAEWTDGPCSNRKEH